MIPVNLELVNELWLPNIFIYNLKTFKVVEVLSKHAGLWITTGKKPHSLIREIPLQTCSSGATNFTNLCILSDQVLPQLIIFPFPYSQWCFLLTSHTYYFHMSYEIWCFSIGYSGRLKKFLSTKKSVDITFVYI